MKVTRYAIIARGFDAVVVVANRLRELKYTIKCNFEALKDSGYTNLIFSFHPLLNEVKLLHCSDLFDEIFVCNKRQLQLNRGSETHNLIGLQDLYCGNMACQPQKAIENLNRVRAILDEVPDDVVAWKQIKLLVAQD